jgi:Zn-dependent protease with chaperone function
MSITATRFATQIRTWLLIAALTALLIAIGGAIGGGALYIFVALAVLMNVVGYWFSDKLALAASRARPLEAGEIPELEEMAADLAQRAGVPMPRLYLVGSEQPNAFATGRNPAHAAIIVAPIAATLLQLGVSRQREYLADATGANLLGRAAPLADALETLERGSEAIPMNVNPAMASMYAVNPLPRRGIATLFATHPPITERIRRLRALDGDRVVALAA